jgi:hypothetical protein
VVGVGRGRVVFDPRWCSGCVFLMSAQFIIWIIWHGRVCVLLICMGSRLLKSGFSYLQIVMTAQSVMESGIHSGNIHSRLENDR